MLQEKMEQSGIKQALKELGYDYEQIFEIGRAHV